MTDCLLIGFNDEPFEQFEQRVRLMGTQSGGYRDLGLAFFQSEGRLYRAMDILNDVCQRDRASRTSPFSNKDLLWLVITYLGSCLARRGLSFDYINSFQDGREALRQKLQSGQVLTVAITTTHYVSHDPLIEVISFVRACNPRVQIIVGGPFIYNRWMASAETLLPQLKLLNADIYVISQEGERTLARAVEAVKMQRSLADIPNLVYRDGAAWATTAIEPEANSLAENPVNYGLFPRSDLGRFVLLRTSKSCPFACAFCNFPQRAGKYQMVDVSQVEAELDALRDLGTVDTLTFIDDTFNVPITRFKDILRMMIRNRYGFRWNSYFRCDQADEECLDLMRESGCEGVFLGIESGSARMLELMNKTARPHHYRRMIPLLKRAGIVTHANLIVGFPGETEASVLETLDLIEEAAPDFYRAQLWYADPTTPVWQQKETYGIRGSSFNWSHATMDADAAADWVEHLFCVVRNSLWLPQWSFETWSLFYLQRHGMTLAQIKTFVRCFNAAIKEKLIRPGRTEVSSGVLRTVRESCRYWTSRAPDLSSIERFDGYSQAYSYWCREGAMLPVAPRNRTTEHAPAEVTYEHVGTVRSRQPDNTESPPARFLAGLAAFAAQQEGGNDAYLFVGDSARDEVYPLRVVLAGCETISDAAAAVAAKLEEGRPHREFGLHCVRQVARRQLGGEPRVRFGVIERTQEGTNPGPTSLTTLLRERGWHDSPEWVLEMVRSDAAAELNIEIYGRKCQSLQTSGSQLLEILACSESQPDAVLSQEPFRLKNNLPTWREDALEEFQFSATE